ncbi:MAG: cytochrome-c peroxidase [Myxococcales bacterium]|nr:cytochrome-c peroxidase [Myxococcales bacterium]
MTPAIRCLLVALIGSTSIACVDPLVPPPDRAVGSLPARVPSPDDNPTTAEKVTLGRLLFWDPILSGDRDVACATCHHPDFAYADGRALSVGVGGTGLGPARVASTESPHGTTRNAMSVLDTAWNGVNVRGESPGPAEAPMFWDNRTLSLEAQALGPIRNLDEMRGTSFDDTQIVPEISRRLSEIPEYVALFEAAFGSRDVTEHAIVRAIAAFERTLVARDSSFDRYMLGDESAMSPAQKRGLFEFVARGCTRCHSGPMFSDFRLHTIPAGKARHGRGSHTPGGVMRTASLRNVTRTAPYFQDGSHATLDDVFTFYAHVDRSADPDLAGIDAPMPIDFGARSDLEAFFTAISDAAYDTTVPDRLPSGLRPGGAIP